MKFYSAYRFMRVGVLLAFLFPSVHLFAEEFSSYLFQQIDPKKKNTIGVVFTDSLGLAVNERTVDVNTYIPNKNILEKNVYKMEYNGKWNLRQRMLNTRMEPLEKDFFAFLKDFSFSREMQISRTIFPLPVTYKSKDGLKEKRLIMPRDWEELKIWQRSPSFRSILPLRHGNNRKVILYQQGKAKEYYNFIYINKVWYLIEMEVYI